MQAWVRAQGWPALRPIQVAATDAIMGSDDDLIIAASTAGGKTEAAFLPLVSQVIDAPAEGGGFDLLGIAPLKALITDQTGRLSSLCEGPRLPVTPWHGDIGAGPKSRALKTPRGLLLITPESLEALFVRRGTDIPRLFAATRAVVVDELHALLDSERGMQVRSLLARLEQARGRPLRRIGLSATLGDMDLARAGLRPDQPDAVRLILGPPSGAELKIQLRGYLSGRPPTDAKDPLPSEPGAEREVAEHLFRHLRGSDNLVFAGSRGTVETYAALLRDMCEAAALPQEFHAHHASISRDERAFIEAQLKNPQTPATAVCTSTLELGIDIGDVACVAQIGAPFMVASLRQRLGRSGRRLGRPAILRGYTIETRLTGRESLPDRLRLGTFRATAMIELLLEGWCEPQREGALHLSTLTHQVLSVIASRGGATAAQLHRILCVDGAFRNVPAPMLTDLLRALGRPEIALIEQGPGGLLLLGREGERLVEHYSFYAVFSTPEEYRLMTADRTLGTLPVTNILAPSALLIFGGRRWTVREVHARERVILVEPAAGGRPPTFGGAPGDIHDRVIEAMQRLYEGDAVPLYLDAAAANLLREGRAAYASAGMSEADVIPTTPNHHVIVTRVGTILTTTLALALALALQKLGHRVEHHDGLLEVATGDDAPPLHDSLARIADQDEADFEIDAEQLMFEKFHPFLTPALLRADALSSRLDVSSLPDLCRRLRKRWA